MRSTRAVWATAFALLFVALIAAGCSTNVPPGQQIDDATITASVKSKLAIEADTAAHNIDVDTNSGVVTLTGEVDTAEERRKAETIARNTNGVSRVNNLLTVDTATGK